MAKRKLSADQSEALKRLQERDNVFLTGKAGTGKSFLIEHYLAQNSTQNIPVVASTGAAALLVGGRTFHSFFGLGILEGGLERTIERAYRSKKLAKRLKAAHGVVIDEISMIPGIALEAAEQVARLVRDSDAPWGGLRVVAVGDFWQLPPVTRTGEKDWAFLSEAWERSGFYTVALNEVLRTKDERFLQVLNEIRTGELSEDSHEFLMDKVESENEEFEGTRLFPLKAQVDQYNLYRLEQLRGAVEIFETQYSGENEQAKQDLRRIAPIPEQTVLKKDALIMLIRNDPLFRYVNGSLGHVKRTDPEQLTIELMNGEIVQVQRTDFSLLDADGKTIASARNFPVRLAYASTIHKAQGMTIDKMRADLGRSWEHGQTYVALSRVKTSRGLSLSAWNPRSIVVDPAVKEFYRDFG